MHRTERLNGTSPAFRLMIATSWLAPDSWRADQQETIREAIDARPDWTEYLALLERHRTPALGWAALSRVPGIEIPEGARIELERRSDACRMQAVRHCVLFAEVLKAFNCSGIPVMPFKGPTLSLELYGDVGLRQSRDLDLAVTREDLPRARACLESMGWCLDSSWFPLSPRQWESFLRHEHNLDFALVQGGCDLELHWRNQWDTPAQTRSCWARSISSTWQGCSYQAMNPIDLVLYLCNHGGDHEWFRAKWLGDLACVYALGRVDWETVIHEARRTGQERVLLLGLSLLDQVYGLSMPELVADQASELPPLLIETSLCALKNPEEPGIPSTSPSSFRNRLRVSHYDKLLRPGREWSDRVTQFLYSREDFRSICLPDSLFWAYVLLRPLQWTWRWVRLSGQRAATDR